MTQILKRNTFICLCKDFIGSKVISFHLIRYVAPDGSIESSDVELELVCENDVLLRMATASDGERISISHEPWTDPFKEPICDENQRFIQKHGKWSFFDLSTQPPFSKIVGKSILAFEGLQNQFGVLAGVTITCGNETVCFCVDGDEGKLFWGRDNPEMIALGFKRLESAAICRYPKDKRPESS